MPVTEPITTAYLAHLTHRVCTWCDPVHPLDEPDVAVLWTHPGTPVETLDASVPPVSAADCWAGAERHEHVAWVCRVHARREVADLDELGLVHTRTVSA